MLKKYDLLRRCCLDGLRDIPMKYSCTRRSLYISEGLECIRAFRYCCWISNMELGSR
uniref:Anaphylatoxin-like domain-containing protein n=1 Tax=Periophthalmus magnuspinnatus TaxID=409849 RepID=A0A3B3ZTL8_9GOBI